MPKGMAHSEIIVPPMIRCIANKAKLLHTQKGDNNVNDFHIIIRNPLTHCDDGVVVAMTKSERHLFNSV